MDVIDTFTNKFNKTPVQVSKPLNISTIPVHHDIRNHKSVCSRRDRLPKQETPDFDSNKIQSTRRASLKPSRLEGKF